MALSMRSSTMATPALRASRSTGLRVVCQAQREQESSAVVGRHLAATLIATSLLASPMIMPEAAEAAKSSGRVGGSSGFAARKAPPPATQSRTVVNNTTIVAAPPVVASPFGFGGFGFSFMPTFFMPIPIFGGLFQIFFLLIVVSVVFSVIRAFTSGNNNAKKDDGWGDL